MSNLLFNFNPFPVISTERLILRQLDTDDCPDVFALRTDERVNQYLERPEISSLEEAKDFICSINQGISANIWIYWAISQKRLNRLVGTVCLWNLSAELREGELGYELLPDMQGMGIMNEALSKVIDFGFNKMHLKRILAYTHIENERSSRLLEKFNFIMSGVNEDNIGERIYELTSPV